MSSFRFDLRSAGAALAPLVLMAGALGGGCGGGGVDYTLIANFCQALAQADCSQPVVEACYGTSAGAPDLPTDVQSCVTRRSTPEVCNPLNLQYHDTYAQPCVDAHAAAYGSGQVDAAALQSMTQACLPALNQAGEQGTSCSADTDCDVGSGLSCVIHQGSSGTCQTPTTIAPGSPCTSPSAECSTGYFCEASGFCDEEPIQGQACSATLACGPGLRCASDVCASQLPDSSACTAATDCTGGLCIATSGTTSVCATNYTFGLGAPTCEGFLPD
jgi:hypothetical protein